MSEPRFSVKIQGCEIEGERGPDALRLRFVGQITENFTGDEVHKAVLAKAGGLKSVNLDLGDVSRINSMGAREWLLFLEQLQSRFSCRFEIVSEVMIELASIAPNILGKKGTPIEIFKAPYFCAVCNKRYERKINASNIESVDGELTPPAMSCPVCASELDFDAVPEDYFNFLRSSFRRHWPKSIGA